MLCVEVLLPEANHLPVNVSKLLNYTGFQAETLKSNWDPHYWYDYTSEGKYVNFAIVFGVLFSGVTGIMAGANMSGRKSRH